MGRTVWHTAIFVSRLDVFSREGLTVMEFDTFAQFKFERELVYGSHGGCEFKIELIGIFGPHWAARQIAENKALENELAKIGVGSWIPVTRQRFGCKKHHWAAGRCRISGVEQKIMVQPWKTHRGGNSGCPPK